MEGITHAPGRSVEVRSLSPAVGGSLLWALGFVTNCGALDADAVRALLERIATTVATALGRRLLTAEELAARLGVSVRMIGRLPDGLRSDTVRRWTNVVGDSVVAVIADDDPAPSLVEDALLEASGVALLCGLDAPPDALLRGEMLDLVGELARAVLVPEHVLEEVIGEPRPYREGNLEDEARWESYSARIRARAPVSDDVARFRIGAYHFARLGPSYFVSDECSERADQVTHVHEDATTARDDVRRSIAALFLREHFATVELGADGDIASDAMEKHDRAMAHEFEAVSVQLGGLITPQELRDIVCQSSPERAKRAAQVVCELAGGVS